MKKPTIDCLFLSLACLSVPSPSFGVIDMNPKEVIVRDKTTPVKITNKGDRPEYVMVTLSYLINPGVELAQEKLEPVGLMAKPLLYAYPFRVNLTPGQSKIITLKPLQKVDREKVYRLEIKPVINVQTKEHGKTVGNIILSLSFNGLVRQLPLSEQAKLSVTCEASGARLSANGNVRYRVEGAKVNGQLVEAFNVYPDLERWLRGRRVEIPGHSACNSK